MDDRRVGLVLRELRRRRRLRQVDLAASSGASQSAVSRVESGHLDTLSIRLLRGLFASVDARVEIAIRWRGGGLDRVLDQRHAALAEAVTRTFVRLGWDVLPEVTYQRFGERGSIDLLIARPQSGAVAIVELKTEIASVGETQRRLDEKARLGPHVARERLGWAPRHLARLLVVVDDTTSRRRLAAHAALFEAAYPARGWQVRAWLRRPSGPLNGIWMVPLTHRRGLTRKPTTPTRVRPRSDLGNETRPSVAARPPRVRRAS